MKILKFCLSRIEPRPGASWRASFGCTTAATTQSSSGYRVVACRFAFAVAGALRLPMDVLVVSKIGTPWNYELAMGALAEDGVQVLDLSMIEQLHIPEVEVQASAAAARSEVGRRQDVYRGGRAPLQVEGKTVILVDDGIATGCSVLAAMAAIRRRRAARVVLAVPVAPASSCNAIR